MISVSQEYKNTLATGRRDFNVVLYIILTDYTQIGPLTNADLRSFTIDDAVSDDNKFTMLGSTIINQCTIGIDNIKQDYTQLNFENAYVIVYLDYVLLNGQTERIKKGSFFVDTATYTGGIIELTCLDFMAYFDLDYSYSKVVYPATINTIIEDACDVCGVPLAENITIPHGDFEITKKPDAEEITFRDVLSWIGEIIGCYAKCDVDGNLTFGWCNRDSLDAAYGSLDGGEFDNNLPKYTSGDKADGGSFKPWNIGYVFSSATFAVQSEVHNFYYNFTQSIATIDTVITGVEIVIIVDKNSTDDTVPEISDEELENGADIVITDEESEDSEDKVTKSFFVGQEGYILIIENNGFISEDTAPRIIQWLSEQLIGTRFRRATTYHLSDPTIEAGDVGILWDKNEESYPIIVTRTNFKVSGQQQSVCGSESAKQNKFTTAATIWRRHGDLIEEEEIEETWVRKEAKTNGDSE